MAESLHIDVKQDDDSGSEKADRFAQKVSSLERIFLIANFILELPSAAFDQLSSVHKPQYALLILLELLTGKKSIFKDEDNGGAVTTLVDFAVPKILANELVKVLDDRIGPPELVKEAEAVELVAYTALHCVNLEGNNRPSMTNIVANLDQASSPCDVRNEGLPISAEQLHGRSNKEVATPMEQRSINQKIHQKGNNNSAFECKIGSHLKVSAYCSFL
ncbi:hypothetical protein GH714_013499 [Hevea brasiliensis]|uniref:Serine-threonine/tyrosine-protein kinase catalytic domain-containing protein n=1 Tax=Hevea brasiliensis TaxID=3981 RepID=A0A6A6MYV4_HEVBR|nr:hypothetical protein GH714_013499 [Hevea brasiliensis]